MSSSVFVEHDLQDPFYEPCRHHFMRSLVHRGLSREKQREGSNLGAWSLRQRPRPNTPLSLCRGAMSLRLLKAGPGAIIPPPGRNRARKAYYSNSRATLMGVGASNLLGIWDFFQVPIELDDEEPIFVRELRIRIVRPIGDWKFGSLAQFDIDFWLPSTSSELENLEFQPMPELDLRLPIDYDAEEIGDVDDERG